ncbi:hypothetical protein GGH94_000509 [Coemansia aciculifera]|uniref:Ca3427-like PBP 2 domain-containing protein n=1 Tax=Coemansia aciculifera TaxID=417176 RepID=A0A9W8M5R4_9FUNG|nr:hypothetical protein GGH94_000509 [Coemansia aciculifera]KAJ2876858.1 hypothetical protein GGH93_000451 [Coemansia aciculifera]
MEVDLSPEEYFRHQAATALLHNNEDAIEDVKEAWSDIDDASAAEEDPVVLKKKRILRHGRSRLADMQERFNTGKSRLYDARQQQLDLELAQLQDGTHPRYREIVDQVDARWSDRLAKIEQKMESSCSFAETKFISSQTAATNTFVAGRAELRRAMIYRRNKHMWALTDELRNLEKIRDAIVNIACPVLPAQYIKPFAAGRYSHHLLDVSGVPPPLAEDDADLSAICSIPSLLNHSDTDISMPEDAAAVALSPALADAADTRVPGSVLGYAAKEQGDSAPMYAYHDTANPRNSSSATLAAAAAAERGEYYQYGGHNSSNGYHPAQPYAGGHPRHPSYYDTAGATEPGASEYATHHQAADHRPAASSKISDLLQPNADTYSAYDSRHSGRQPQSTVYYDSTRPHGVAAPTALGKHEMLADFEDAPTKRQRMVQPSTTWPTAPASSYAHPQQYAGAAAGSRSWTDLSSAATATAVEGYSHNYQKYPAPPATTANSHGSSTAYQSQYQQVAPGDHHAYYSQQHYQQHGYQQQQSASGASYYGAPTAKYDYPKESQAAYYQRQPTASTSTAAPAQQHGSVHYHDGAYYQSAPGHYQQPTATAGVRTSDPYYSYKQQGGTAPAGYPPQQPMNNGAAWNDYYQQQYAQAGAAGQQPHHRYPQQMNTSGPTASAQHGPEYYERGGYYNGHHQQQQQQRPPTYSSNVPEHFSAPLMYAVENDKLRGVKVELVICKLGTGEMIKKLVAGELDIAICVTEGLVAGIGNTKEADLRLFGTYVDSPLPWAASVNIKSAFSSMDDLAFGATFGISREGSGSQVMAKFAAFQYEWKEPPKFKILGDVNGLVAGIQNGEADAFLWERTTMNRHYAKDEVRYLGTVRAPWPAFSFGARKEFIENNSALIDQLLCAIGSNARAFMDSGNDQIREEYVCGALGYSQEDYRQWMGYVVYNFGGQVDRRKIGAVVKTLVKAGVMATGDIDVVLEPQRD